jgi:hypothetical protein
VDAGDAADLDTGDPHVVARVDGGGGGEVGADRLGMKEGIADDQSRAGDDEHRQHDR